MVGEKLKQAREKMKLSQQEMADELNIGRAGYGRYEQGTSEPTLPNLAKICKKLEISADWLLGIEVDKFAPTYRRAIDLIQELEENYNSVIEEIYFDLYLDNNLTSTISVLFVAVNDNQIREFFRLKNGMKKYTEEGNIPEEICNDVLGSQIVAMDSDVAESKRLTKEEMDSIFEALRSINIKMET